jgi:3-mercaptopyruvate sulfurtransferase SseA
MSWNAAKRAPSYGYSNVAWYPEGTDGWQRADLPVAESQPEPREDEEGPSPHKVSVSLVRILSGGVGEFV